jgi:plasmid stabilization system protein ParE
MIAYRFLDVAQRELDEILRWYSVEAPGLEVEFLDELGLTLERARRFPRSGALVQALDVRTLEVRRFLLRRFPYKVIAAVQPDALIIVALARGSRAPSYWRGRLRAMDR